MRYSNRVKGETVGELAESGRRRRRHPSLAAIAVMSLLLGNGLCAIARADGTETLGPPSIEISQGSGVVAAGVGLGAPGIIRVHRSTVQPSIQLNVPGTRVNQALLYWSGEGLPAGDNELIIDNGSGPQPVTGMLIGGPTEFFGVGGFGKVYVTTFRADVTDLIDPGPNTLIIDGVSFGFSNSGAGLLVIYDDGTSDDVTIRDGQDLAFARFLPPLDTTVPQTFTFLPSENDRTGRLTMFFGSVGTEVIRPTLIRITVEGGDVLEFPNLLASVDGPLWDTVRIDVNIPAGSTSLTVEALSVEDGTHVPASMNWIAASLMVDTPGPCEFVDCDDSDACTDDFCNPETGECEYTQIDCDDGDACTADSCDPAIGCIHEDITPTCDDGIECTTDGCDPATGCTYEPDDTLCDDSDLCTSDTCDPVEGCVYEDISDECDDGDACTADSCDPAIGCIHEDITPTCDDGIECTTDGCDPATGCTYEPDNTLCDDSNLCTSDTCDPVEGCVYEDISDECDDGDACTADSCDPAIGCVHEDITPTCDDGVECTVDDCDPATGCTYEPDDTLCDDSDLCTEESCDPVQGCIYEDISDQCDDGNVCTLDSCDPLVGCVHEDVSDVCVDHIECTIDGCDPNLGCVYTPDDSLCNDDDACTSDTCDTAVGCVFEDISDECDDNNVCTLDRCDPAVGCVYDDISDECNDGVECTVDDCDPVSGCTNVPDDTLCDDDDACTEDTCDAILGCVYVDISDQCDDNDACTADRCDPAVGCVNDDISDTCNDGVACTHDRCDPSTGCVNTPDDLLCDDDDICTRDVCTLAGCQYSSSGLCQACCIDDDCFDLTVDECQSRGGIPQGVGTTCETVICPVCGNGVLDSGEECDGSDDDACPGFCMPNCMCPTNIPTVSTWGTIVLGLLLLVLAKVAFGLSTPHRRRLA